MINSKGDRVMKGPSNQLHRTFGITSVTKKGHPDITEVDMEVVRSTFWRYDTDNDGLLSKHELIQAFHTLGSNFPWFRALRALSHADLDHDGFISPDEFDRLLGYAIIKFGHRLKTTP